MSLYDFIYNLQRKPHQTKQRVLIGLLAFCFIVLAVLWVFMFKSQVAEDSSAQSKSGLAKTFGAEKMVGPVAALIDGFKNLKSDVSDKIKEFKGTIGSENIGARQVYELPEN